MKKAVVSVRRALLAAAGNASLFLFTAFLVIGVLPMEPLKWYGEVFALLERYVVVPWGMALCLLRLERRAGMQDDALRADAAVLGALLAWIVVPFALRFGVTFNNIGSWCNHAIVFFGVYLLITEKTAQERGHLLNQAGLLFALLALVWGGALLYCAAAARSYGADPDLVLSTGGTHGFGFGVYERANLCAGIHYNSTGMIALCCAMLSLCGASGSGKKPVKLLSALAFVMMALVVVLTQSRTARYALIVALALGAYGWFVSRHFVRRTVASHAAGIAIAAVVLVLGYQGASMLTDAALRHYARAASASVGQFSSVAAALAEEETAQTTEPAEARAAVDATLSGRTDIWNNLFRLWEEDPKYMLIGNGVGRTGSRIVEGTIHEQNGAVALHNTYLQFIADFGLIGFALLAAWLLLLIRPFLRVLFARDAGGYRPLCMLAAACMLTGLMESAPFGAMTPMNMALLFALAQIMGRSRDMQSLVQKHEPVL